MNVVGKEALISCVPLHTAAAHQKCRLTHSMYSNKLKILNPMIAMDFMDIITIIRALPQLCWDLLYEFLAYVAHKQLPRNFWQPMIYKTRPCNKMLHI